MTIDVIIPIYGGFDALRQCLYSVLESRQQSRYHLVLINDASPEAQIADYLDEISQSHQHVSVVHNHTNQGFVKSVNIGMAQNMERDVILLNSDTIVANNWIDRLHRCAYQNKNIGTVTPFSNNATICSFPTICKENQIPDGWSIEALDDIFSTENHNEFVQIPTAIGFCMFIKRTCLNDVGYFDDKLFGRGYGEENDFCMRASRKGWTHQLCTDTFVYHIGSVSFSAEKEKRLAAAMKTMSRKHPKYHGLVADHIRNNPAGYSRVKVLLELIRKSDKQKILFANHNMGGGTEKCVQELCSQGRKKIWPIVIRPVNTNCVRLSLDVNNDAESFIFQMPTNYEGLLGLCRYLKISRIHFHHILDFHPKLLGIARDLDLPMDITLHDYYFINANPTLTDASGRFCAAFESRDKCCATAVPIPNGMPPDKWRSIQLKFLNSAKRIFAPSAYTATLFKAYFAAIEPIVAYHTDWEHDAPYPAPRRKVSPPGKPLRILVIGALNQQKGADLLEGCARYAKCRAKSLKFKLVGYAYRPLRSVVKKMGPYHDADLDGLIAEADPHIIWFPALWPETYSYTLSAALRSGIPIVAPDIGAFPERLKDRPYTWVEPWDKSEAQWCDFFISVKQNYFEKKSKDVEPSWHQQPNNRKSVFRYRTHFVIQEDQKNPSDEENIIINHKWLSKHMHGPVINADGNRELSKKERVLITLFKVRENYLIHKITNLIPYRFQRLVKRRLSKRPVHEFYL